MSFPPLSSVSSVDSLSMVSESNHSSPPRSTHRQGLDCSNIDAFVGRTITIRNSNDKGCSLPYTANKVSGPYSAPHCTALHCTTLHCTPPHCTAIHSPLCSFSPHSHKPDCSALPLLLSSPPLPVSLQGDSCNTVAQLFGTSRQTIQSLNPAIDCSVPLVPGQIVSDDLQGPVGRLLRSKERNAQRLRVASSNGCSPSAQHRGGGGSGNERRGEKGKVQNCVLYDGFL